MDPLFITFPLVLFVGVVSSWYDLRRGRVPNVLIFPFFGVGVLVYAIMFFLTDKINPHFVLTTITNLLCALVLAFWMWKKKWWYGGDAKLFVLYALLVPVSIYQNGYIEYFPSLVLLINVFVPFTIWSIGSILSHAKTFPLQPILFAALSIFSLSWLSTFVPSTLAFIAIVLLSNLVPVQLQGVIAVLRFFGDTTVWSKAFALHFFFWTMLLLGVRQFISANAEVFVHRGRAKTGDILAEEVTFNKHKLAKETMLAEKQASKIRHAVLSYDTVPFALCLFLGVLITIVAKGTFIALISFI